MRDSDYNAILYKAKRTETGTGYLVNVRYIVSKLPENRAEFARSCRKSHSWINNIIRTGRTSGLSARILIEELDLDPKKLFFYDEPQEESKEEQPAITKDQNFAIADSLDSINETLKAINDRLFDLLRSWEGK